MKIKHFDKTDIIKEFQQSIASGGRVNEESEEEIMAALNASRSARTAKLSPEQRAKSERERRVGHRERDPNAIGAPDDLPPFDMDTFNRMAALRRYPAHHYHGIDPESDPNHPDNPRNKPVDEGLPTGNQTSSINPALSAIDKMGSFAKSSITQPPGKRDPRNPNDEYDEYDDDIDEAGFPTKHRGYGADDDDDDIPAILKPSGANTTTTGKDSDNKIDVDASADKILNKVIDKWLSYVTEGEKLTELSVKKMEAYRNKVLPTQDSPPKFGIDSVMKVRNHETASRKIASKIGQNTNKHVPDRGAFDESNDLNEVKDRWAAEKKIEGNDRLNEISQGERNRQKREAKHAADEQARLAREKEEKRKTNKNARIGKKYSDIGDVVKAQHQDNQADEPPVKREEPVSIPFHGWEIKYRPASAPGEPVEWIINRNGETRQTGEAKSDQAAVAAAEDWITGGAGGTGRFRKNATIDFNKKFVDDFAPEGEKFYSRIVPVDGKPYFMFSQEPFEDASPSAIRAGDNFPSISIKPAMAQLVGLNPHGRYTLDMNHPEELADVPGAFIFKIIPQGVVHDKSERQHMPDPGFTVAHPRDKMGDKPDTSNNEFFPKGGSKFLEKIDPWQGYTPDDRKAGALSKSPKSTMQGKPGVPFSELVKDSIETHGVKWAFDYYVKKHGLPPRQFQIFAGLTADPPKKDRVKGDWTDPSRSNRPREKQGWWQRLLSKLE